MSTACISTETDIATAAAISEGLNSKKSIPDMDRKLETSIAKQKYSQTEFSHINIVQNDVMVAFLKVEAEATIMKLERKTRNKKEHHFK